MSSLILPSRMLPKLTNLLILELTFIFFGVNGNTCRLKCVYYNLPSTYVRFFSPHTYHNMNVECVTAHDDHTMMHLSNHKIKIPIYFKCENIPTVTVFFVNSKER